MTVFKQSGILESMDISECLAKTGLTGQEGTLYLALCGEGQLTGYEAAKVAGVSRSNAYHALSALVAKGGAYRIEGDPASYAPVPPAEYVRNARRKLEEALAFIETELPRAKAPNSPFLTVNGRGRIIDKMKNLIEDASLRVYVSMAEPEMALVRIELEAAAARGVKVVAISDSTEGPAGAFLYIRKKRAGQVRLIADSEHVLTGDLTEGGSCVYSRNAALIQLIKDSLIDEMALSENGTAITGT